MEYIERKKNIKIDGKAVPYIRRPAEVRVGGTWRCAGSMFASSLQGVGVLHFASTSGKLTERSR